VENFFKTRIDKKDCAICSFIVAMEIVCDKLNKLQGSYGFEKEIGIVFVKDEVIE